MQRLGFIVDQQQLEPAPQRQWTPKGARKKKLSSDVISRAEAFRMKKRSDLLSCSRRQPGALAALLLYQAKLRSHGSAPEDTDALRSVDATAWATSCHELKDIRDQKEVHFLGRILSQWSDGKCETGRSAGPMPQAKAGTKRRRSR